LVGILQHSCLQTFSFEDTLENQQLGCLWQGDDLITISLSGEITYLDVNNPNKPKRVIRGHQKNVTALCFDSKNNKLYSASYDSVMINWDVSTGATEQFIGKGHSNQVNYLAIQGDNLISCGMDNSIRITPLSTRTYSSESITTESIPRCLAVGKKDAKLIVAVVSDSILIIKSGKIVNKNVVKFQPTCVALSIDETQLAVGGKDNSLHLYSLSGDKLNEVADLTGHRGALGSISYCPDGKHLASADHNRDIFVWDLNTKQIKIRGWVYHSAAVYTLAWAPDAIHLASGSLDSCIYVWNIAAPDKRVCLKDAHRGGVNCVLWLDGNTVASCGQDCCIKSWTIPFQ